MFRRSILTVLLSLAVLAPTAAAEQSVTLKRIKYGCGQTSGVLRAGYFAMFQFTVTNTPVSYTHLTLPTN